MASTIYEVFNDCWDSANHALKCLVSYVHTHANDDEGGQLDWDSVWSDAVHSHASDAEGGKLDHGAALTGLTDDDHTQYVLESTLTTQGDLPYASGASTWTRLAKGTADQILRMNAGATAPEWAASPGVPQYGIIIWTGTIANIPAGYVICDGNNSSPNLLAKFVEGVATAETNPGTTGGATSKTTEANMGKADSGATPNGAANSIHYHDILDIRPLYYDVAFIMKT